MALLNEVKPEVRRKETDWEEMLAASDKEKDVWKNTEKKRKIKRCMSQDIKECKRTVWKEDNGGCEWK